MSEVRSVDANKLLDKSVYLYYEEYTGILEAPYRQIPCISVERIKNAPTIEPPVVRGEWIDNGDYVTTAYGTLHVYRCSNCNEDITIDNHESFCPNCGADMRGAE